MNSSAPAVSIGTHRLPYTSEIGGASGGSTSAEKSKIGPVQSSPALPRLSRRLVHAIDTSTLGAVQLADGDASKPAKGSTGTQNARPLAASVLGTHPACNAVS